MAQTVTPIPLAGPTGAEAPAVGPVAAAAALGPAARVVPTEEAQGRRSPLARVFIHFVLILGMIVSFFPFYWMVTSSFKTNSEAIASPPTWIPTQWHPENYLIALNAAPFPRYFFNTFFVALWSVVGVLVVSSLAAYAFARMEFYGKNTLFTIFLATLMIPSEVTLIPNFVIITRWFGWYDTYQAQFIVGIGSVFAIFLLRQFFMTIPKDLEDAAMIDGCSRFRFLWNVVVPLSGPALITLALLNFLGAWNAFLWPLIVTRSPQMRPIQVGLQVFSSDAGSRYAELMAASTLVILPTVLLFLVAQKYLVEGIARTGLKG
jgi:multiple sugar transport system permease protein